jgi:HD-GYP domain-containing protein (c-di-GMP phosphodiesterase class II)
MIHRTVPEGAADAIALGDVLTGLSHALDLAEGHPAGHTARACLIGMRLAHIVGIRASDRTHLFYALLLKDAGCSSNAARVHELLGGSDQEAKRGVWLRDWRSLLQQAAYGLEYAGRGGTVWDRITHLARLAKAGPRGRRQLFEIRCDRGAAIALDLGLSDSTAAAIRTMDEHWDGGGEPRGLRQHDIPVLGRIISLAQVVEIFSHDRGPDAALDVAEARNGRWFDPDLVRALRVLTKDRDFWPALNTEHPQRLVAAAEPTQFAVVADDPRMDRIAEAFATVIDAKSPYTGEHSRRVADLAVAIASRLGFSKSHVARMRRAALLHDIGKLGVPNSILDKPSTLTADEWRVVQQHPANTLQILQAVPGFRDFAFDAACHHEKLDGSGYHRGYAADRLTPAARALAVADMTGALLANRPHRGGLAPQDALGILRADCARGAICAASVAAVADFVAELDSIESRAIPHPVAV